MLSTHEPLKCKIGNKLPNVYFQYPDGDSPGGLDELPSTITSFLHEHGIAHYIFLELLPFLAGLIVFLFFLISSSFIVYGIIRHIYTDHMLPRKKKTLRRLGKFPEEKRRKKYRRNRSSRTSLGHEGSSLLGTTSKTSSKSYGNHLTVEKPYYLDDSSDYSEYRETKNDPVEIISFTSPPMKIERNPPLPTIPKPIYIPGQKFPVLPDVPKTLTKPSPPIITETTDADAEIKTKSPNRVKQPIIPSFWDSTYKNEGDELHVSAKTGLDKLLERRETLRQKWNSDIQPAPVVRNSGSKDKKNNRLKSKTPPTEQEGQKRKGSLLSSPPEPNQDQQDPTAQLSAERKGRNSSGGRQRSKKGGAKKSRSKRSRST